ncbi:hypothetical protein Q7P36_002191 [Cladosporium allicinum]
MKSITCLLALLLVALLSVGVYGLDQSVIIPTDLREACLKKDDGANVVAAIENFCKNTKIVVPSSLAGQGGSGGPKNNLAHIGISGKCSPAQWVPQHYCYKQFYYMCWKGNNRGSYEKSYGRKKCQDWLISN